MPKNCCVGIEGNRSPTTCTLPTVPFTRGHRPGQNTPPSRSQTPAQHFNTCSAWSMLTPPNHLDNGGPNPSFPVSYPPSERMCLTKLTRESRLVISPGLGDSLSVETQSVEFWTTRLSSGKGSAATARSPIVTTAGILTSPRTIAWSALGLSERALALLEDIKKDRDKSFVKVR